MEVKTAKTPIEINKQWAKIKSKYKDDEFVISVIDSLNALDRVYKMSCQTNIEAMKKIKELSCTE
jgi:hypothetical protein